MAGLQVFPDAASMRAFSRQQRCDGKSIALVPTMVSHSCRRLQKQILKDPDDMAALVQGYLHAGHISLIEIARQV